MRLIVLAGLVTVEKTAGAVELTQYFARAGQIVTILDHASRIPVDAEGLGGVTLIRLEGDLQASLSLTLAGLSSEIAILVASESLPPDDLFLLLDDLRSQIPSLEMQTIALIDTRTCDCFPQFRVTLESCADAVVRLPVAAGEFIEVVV
jgi:hypothetical protein